MNKDITSLYVINKGNVTVCFGTNLTELYKQFKNLYPDARIYQYYYREFKKSDSFTWEGYYFQRLV